MQVDQNCVFCKIIGGKIPDYRVWEDENFIAFMNIEPISKGHVLVIPKDHVDLVFDLPDVLYKDLFEVGKKLAGPLKQATGCIRVGLSVVGLHIPHVHLHLIPTSRGGDADHSNIYRASKEELTEMQIKIKNEISKL